MSATQAFQALALAFQPAAQPRAPKLPHALAYRLAAPVEVAEAIERFRFGA